MARFEINILADGTDNAGFLESDAVVEGEWNVDSDEHLEVMVWNNSNVRVDVHLETGHRDILIVTDPDHYEEAHREVNWRSFTIDNNPPNIAGVGCTVTIDGLEPGQIFPCRFSNPNGTQAHPWLDASDCTMQSSGHGTNVHNGDIVYVAGHSPTPTT